MKKKNEKKVHLRTVGDPAPPRRPTPVPIIVELSGDGFVQVFGPDHVRVVVINRFDDDGPAAIRAELATLADLFHELELPRLHRPFYRMVDVLATGMVQRRTPEGERRRAEELELIRGLRTLRDELVARQKEKVLV